MGDKAMAWLMGLLIGLGVGIVSTALLATTVSDNRAQRFAELVETCQERQAKWEKLAEGSIKTTDTCLEHVTGRGRGGE